VILMSLMVFRPPHRRPLRIIILINSAPRSCTSRHILRIQTGAMRCTGE
jgi:hypothetical protein